MKGRIKDGQFAGEYPSGPYEIHYEIELEQGQSFLAKEIDLERVSGENK